LAGKYTVNDSNLGIGHVLEIVLAVLKFISMAPKRPKKNFVNCVRIVFYVRPFCVVC